MAISNSFNKSIDPYYVSVDTWSDIEGNEKADVAAKEGAQKQEQNCALEFKTVIAAVKREMKKKWIETAGERNTHCHNATNFTPPNWKKYDDTNNNKNNACNLRWF